MSKGAFSPLTRQLIHERDRGCVICGRGGVLQIHHRSPRQMGGSSAPWVSLPSNGILLCAGDHRAVEQNRSWAEERGYIVRRGVLLPHEKPLVHARYWEVTFLTTRGTVSKYPPEETA